MKRNYILKINNKGKDIQISKNAHTAFFDDTINIKNFDSNNVKIDEK